jgi:hypothetical protein
MVMESIAMVYLKDMYSENNAWGVYRSGNAMRNASIKLPPCPETKFDFIFANRCHQDMEGCSGFGANCGSLRIAANMLRSCVASTPPFSCQNGAEDACCMARS